VRDRGALTELLRRARARCFVVLLADQTSFSLALVMGAAIVLLLVGTELLAWYWLAVIFGGGLAIGIWRIARRFPSTYRLAQRLDRGLGLHDTLSTAFHFRQNPGPSDPAIREEQQRRAEDAARRADLRQAMPFSAPRSIYWTAGLAAAAFSLVGVRYGVLQTMDLHQGMVKIAFDTFFPQTIRVARAKKSPLQKKIEDEMKKAGINVETPEAVKAQDAAPDSVLDVVDEPNVDSADPAVKKSKSDGKSAQDKGDDPEASSENPENAAPGSEQNAEDGSTPTGKNASPQNKEASNNSKQQSNSGDDSSLVDKMRDAMANLMNKLKTPPRAGDSRSAPRNSQNGNLQSRGSQQMGKQGSEESGRQASDSSNSSEQQGNQQEQAQNGQNTQAAQGKSGDRGAEHPPSQDAKSGIGRQDGDKQAREAADLAAMGKISEIIGKRSANLTGEVMVEVPSGRQQLKTPYAERSARHFENGGDINRDEVPLIYQQYVEQYFEEIRKAPPAGVPAPRTKAGESPTLRNKPTKAEE
jgi:hypothetical protein